MELYTYPITVEREGRKYYAYSEDFPGVYGLGKRSTKPKRASSNRCDFTSTSAAPRTARYLAAAPSTRRLFLLRCSLAFPFFLCFQRSLTPSPRRVRALPSRKLHIEVCSAPRR